MENRGGKRNNAGRKKSDIETKVISFRIPIKYETEIKKLLNLSLSKFLKGKKL